VNKEHARETQRSLQIRNFLTPTTIATLRKHKRLLDEDIRVLFALDGKWYGNISYTYDDDDQDDDDYEEYAAERQTRSHHISSELITDLLLERNALNTKLKIQLTENEYATLRQDVCIHERTIRPDIAAEAEVACSNNRPNKFAANCSFVVDLDTNKKYLEAWTDGSTKKDENYVAYSVYWGQNHPLNYIHRLDASKNTNNNAELAAIAHVLRVSSLLTHTIIYTDSQVAINIVNQCYNCALYSGSVHSLTRNDSIETARTKHTLVELFRTRIMFGTRLIMYHVYSHLLDANSKLSAEERQKKTDEMKRLFGDPDYIRILQGNAVADQMATLAKHTPIYPLPAVTHNDPAYIVLMTSTDNKNDNDGDKQIRVGENLRKQIYQHEREEHT
jgi:ribonuclease HI